MWIGTLALLISDVSGEVIWRCLNQFPSYKLHSYFFQYDGELMSGNNEKLCTVTLKIEFIWWLTSSQLQQGAIESLQKIKILSEWLLLSKF